jgi:predicted RNase H-like HicB family nuclease
MRPFIAFISKQTDARFRASFPDLPHCDSTGATILEARANAEFALTIHCRRLKDSGMPVPSPSYLDQIAQSQERATNELVALISPMAAA